MINGAWIVLAGEAMIEVVPWLPAGNISWFFLYAAHRRSINVNFYFAQPQRSSYWHVLWFIILFLLEWAYFASKLLYFCVNMSLHLLQILCIFYVLKYNVNYTIYFYELDKKLNKSWIYINLLLYILKRYYCTP